MVSRALTHHPGSLFLIRSMHFHTEKLWMVNLPCGTNLYSELTGKRNTAVATGPSRSQYFLNHHKEFVMSTITSAIKAFFADENGVTAIEYGLIAALIGVVMAGVAGEVGENIEAAFIYIRDQLVVPE